MQCKMFFESDTHTKGHKLMQCKMFFGMSLAALEKQVNEWLKANAIALESVRFQFSTVVVDLGLEYRVEHTLVVMYERNAVKR